MSIEALWSLQFVNFTGYGGGVVVFETGRVFGGDTSFYWTGEYTVDHDSRLSARIDVARHSDALPSLFGRDNFTLEIEGRIGEREMRLQGHIAGDSSQALAVQLTRQAELPG